LLRLRVPTITLAVALALCAATASARRIGPSADSLHARSAAASQDEVTLVLFGYSAHSDQVTVSGGPSGELIVSAAQGIVATGTPCTPESSTQITCPPGYASRLKVRTLGGDDVLIATPTTPVGVTFLAGPGNDSGTGGNQDDLLVGKGGNDVLSGEGGTDFIVGGAGRDRLFGGDSNDHLNGSGGRDQLFGGPAADRLLGGAGGFDKCVGGPGRDLFPGNPLARFGTCEDGSRQ
jgi:Ca2+-binding RTX toxin-like protein